MYLHVGADDLMPLDEVCVILGAQALERPQPFLEAAKKSGKLRDLSGGNAKSAAVSKSMVILSPIAAATLAARVAQGCDRKQ
ncbi:MAG: DUF370 domain-containing protein [Clostridiales bacterium]|jgi:hypothetical protein|nr:DUF370 domain-containing protein [Clostridiales bacterium]